MHVNVHVHACIVHAHVYTDEHYKYMLLTTRVCSALNGSTLRVAVEGRGMALSEMSFRERMRIRLS